MRELLNRLKRLELEHAPFVDLRPPVFVGFVSRGGQDDANTASDSSGVRTVKRVTAESLDQFQVRALVELDGCWPIFLDTE